MSVGFILLHQHQHIERTLWRSLCLFTTNTAIQEGHAGSELRFQLVSALRFQRQTLLVQRPSRAIDRPEGIVAPIGQHIGNLAQAQV